MHNDPNNRIMMRYLCRALALPWSDVDIALALVRPWQNKNARWYDKHEAAQALEDHYNRRIAENRERYAACPSDLYVKRERIYTERLARVQAWHATLKEDEQHAAGHQAVT